MKILCICVCILAYKVVTNFIAGMHISHCKSVYMETLHGISNNFPQYAASTIKLFKRAGIHDTTILISQPLNEFTIVNSPVSVFDNITIFDRDITARVLDNFENAIGVYKSRIIESFNPIYWIDLIVFSPKKLLEYLDLDLDKHSTKICTILLQIIWWLICTVFLFFQEQIKIYIINLLKITP